MSGKRKRGEDLTADAQVPATATTNEKPLSAIAAARLKARAAAGPKEDINSKTATELVLQVQVSDPLPQSPVPEPGESEPDEEPLPIKQNLKLCNWRNEPQNILSNTSVELTLKLNKHTTIALIGCFQFKVLRGAINVNGANIEVLSRHGHKDQTYTVYAPATHPISKIRGLDGSNHVQFTSCKEPAPLANISPLFSDIWNSASDTNGRSFSVITESGADALGRPLRPDTTSEDWLRAIEDCASNPSISITVGPSHSGKSAFANRLANRYLTGQGKSAQPASAVCYLDLDFTEPEYTPHGQVSLTIVKSLNLGPAFTHPATLPTSPGSRGNETVRSHVVPANLVNYTEYYCACAEDLFLTYKTLRSRDPLLPLIINIPSSLYGPDLKILTDLLARFKPHHVIHLGDTRAIDTDQAAKLHTFQTIVSQYRGTLHEIISHVPISVPMRTNAELRTMHIQSYFHLTKINTWSSLPLSHLTPWTFYFRETRTHTQDFVGFALYAEPVEPSSLIHALNGSIVHIVESTSSAIPSPYTALPRTYKFRLPFFSASHQTGMLAPLDPNTSKVVCTALIRGFDTEEGVVHVLVPKHHEMLLYSLSAERTVFVGGCCEGTGWPYLEDGMVDAPWVEDNGILDGMGYLNTVRRVRKFQT